MPVNFPHRPLLDQTKIDLANNTDVATVARQRGYQFDRAGCYVGPCPHCGGEDRFTISERKQAFRCRRCFDKGGGGAIRLVMFLGKVDFRQAVEILVGEQSSPVKFRKPRAVEDNEAAKHERRQRYKANWLWQQSLPITGTIAEKYLREARGITCPLPPTMKFLPQLKDHHPALISAFGLCGEVEPEVIAAPRDVVAVHLTLLKPDGSKIEVERPKSDKIMLGSPTGRPIVVAPPNDLMGLAIAEGVEDALSAHQALGLGAWAAGSASHMAKLADAVPDWSCVTIYADADQQGERNAAKLAERLRARGVEVIIEGLDA